MPVSVEMPRYQSHKKVHALEIAAISENESSGRTPPGVPSQHPGYTLSFADAGYAPLSIGSNVVSRYFPQKGDFFVVYDDGYQSISPRQPFLDGYAKL